MSASTEIIRTVRGDIKPSEFGRTIVHEHLLMRSPLLRGDELDDVERSAAEAAELKQAGMDALVELTPIGLGRAPRALAKIAKRSGLHVVLATGIHQQAHYSPEHWIHRIGTDELTGLFIRDITEGCDNADYGGPREEPTTIRAGIIKVGAGYWRISPLERRVIEAAGKALQQTGAPIACHLEMGTAAWEVLDILKAGGVPPHCVMFSHVDRNPDPDLHAKLAAAGAYIGYDGMARTKTGPMKSSWIFCSRSRYAAARSASCSEVTRRGDHHFAPTVACRGWHTCRSDSFRGCWKEGRGARATDSRYQSSPFSGICVGVKLTTCLTDLSLVCWRSDYGTLFKA
jgi:predicted metal-dependent phosphotriesterase family hydrolase